MCHETLDGRMVAVVHESHGNTRNQSHVCTDSVAYSVSSSFCSHIASDCGGTDRLHRHCFARNISLSKVFAFFPTRIKALSLARAFSLYFQNASPATATETTTNKPIQRRKQWVPLVTLRMCTEGAVAAVGEHSNAMCQCWKLEGMCRSSSN